jgi:hypothetical protein
MKVYGIIPFAIDSMSAFPVSPEKENQFAQRMAAPSVREADTRAPESKTVKPAF